MISELNAKQFLEMINAGKDSLEKHVDKVNDLNEFPIPDYDTGTNMLYTMLFTLDNVQYVDNIGDLALRIHIRMSACAGGKSGEILARFFGGFTEPLEHKTYLNSKLLRYSFQDAFVSLVRYHQIRANCIPYVVQVMEIMVDAAERLENTNDLEIMMYCMVRDVYEHIQENDITDAGCIGLMHIIEGMSLYLLNYKE